MVLDTVTESGSAALAPVVVGVARGGSEAAVRFGAEEAHRTGRPLDLVHVDQTGDEWSQQLGRDSLHLAADRARSVAGKSLVIQTELLHHSALLELRRAAKDSALLVMERRRIPHQRRPENSTTIGVIDVVDVASAVVPADWQDDQRRVVTVGLDVDAADDRAVRTAIVQARLRGAALRVLVAAAPSADTDYARRLRVRVDQQLSQLGGDACDLAVELVIQPAGEALLHAATTSDLVVLGRHLPTPPSESRLGPVARELLRDATCPVLLTSPYHVHAVQSWTTQTKGTHMYARTGDRIVIRSTHVDGPVRDGEIVAVEHEDGTPPYRVRWSDSGHESLFFPGPDAQVDRQGPSYPPEYDAAAPAG